MGRFKHLVLIIAAGTASAGPQAPASAQCRLCDVPATQMPTESADGDVELQVETSLNFDRLVLSGVGNGAVTIRPDGANNAEGAVVGVGPRATIGTMLVHGVPNRALRIDLPRRIDLYSLGGGHITLLDVTSDLPATPRLDAAGNLRFRFGGRLMVTGDSDGQYRGDLSVTVEYL